MNRLFIIGNGFDIAHGLSTKYQDFINDYWSKIRIADYEDEFISIETYNFNVRLKDKEVKNYREFINLIYSEYDRKFINENAGNICINSNGNSLFDMKFHNELFKKITLMNGEPKWVDIEKEYYQQLKQIVKSNSKDKLYEVSTLNQDFEDIKIKFEEYLSTKVDSQISAETINTEILDFLKIQESTYGRGLENYLMEFPKEDRYGLKSDNEKKKGLFYGELIRRVLERSIKEDTLILNFNYTNLIDTYLEENHWKHLFKHIQIHGKVGNDKNKINFGFGDEMDEDYKMIENLDENEFLRNFKSFGYLQNSNYKNLLDFIELGKFQVIIMGHSCGISDRTMLNTIFEHPNCRSIKPFYYQWKDEEGITHDNFTELVQNISRHFNKKKQMREKVVNKSLCQPLPQFKKE